MKTVEPAAVPVSGEAFAALTALFLVAMVTIAVWRILAKRRAVRPRVARSGEGGGDPVHVADDDGRHDASDSHSGGDGGGGDGGGGGDD